MRPSWTGGGGVAGWRSCCCCCCTEAILAVMWLRSHSVDGDGWFQSFTLPFFLLLRLEIIEGSAFYHIYDSVSIKSLGGRPLPCVVIGGCNARRPTRCFWSKRTLQLEEQQWHWAALYFSPPRLCLSEKCMLPNYPVPYIGCFKI